MRADAEDNIRSRNGSTRSVESQVATAHAMWDHDILPDHDGLKRKDIEDELSLDLDYSTKTTLGHLVDANIVEEFRPPGPEVFVIATWMDEGDGEIVNGSVTEAAEQGLEALTTELESSRSSDGRTATADGSGHTKRSTLVEELDVLPEQVENFLRTTSRQVDVLNDAVEAIEEADDLEVGDDYGEIAFINAPFRYRLTEFAVDLYER
jgi:hypothetical protein